jgi:hypothetical protein
LNINHNVRLFVVVAGSALLSGCGIIGLCGNDCGPGWVHGSFDCGCMQVGPPPGPQTPPPPYSITRRFSCSDNSECDHTVRAYSCTQVLETLNSENYDHCQHCDDRVADYTIHETGQPKDLGGSCVALMDDGKIHAANAHEQNYNPIPQSFVPNLPRMTLAALTPPTENSIATCRLECDRPGAPHCLPLDILATEGSGLSRLQQTVKANPPLIAHSDMLAMFGLTSDDCGRSDTILAHGIVTNVGTNGSCSMTVHTALTDVTLQLPELLRGKITANATEIEAVFEDHQTRANLDFSDPNFKQYYKGDVVALFSKDNYVNFSVGTNRCVRAYFPK